MARSLPASARRLWLVAQLDLQESLRRPFFLFWVAFMGWNAWMVSRGTWFVRSNSTSLGGNLAYVNSEFQIAYVAGIMGFFILSFFVAIAAGTPLIRDAERKVGEILHATPLSPGEYVWGKFLAAAASCLGVLAAFVALVILFTHATPDPARPEAYGPFELGTYVVPVLVFLVPALLFTAGLAFALGRFSGRPILVFFVPVAFFLFYWSFFWGWYPPDMGETARFWFQMIDPSGFRWLRQSYLTVDRGIGFYNSRGLDYSAAFLLSRLGMAAFGLLLVDLARRHFAGRLRTSRRPSRRRSAPPVATASAAAAAEVPPAAPEGSLRSLRMTSRPRGFLREALTVARFEIHELRSHPALYVLIPVLLVLLTLDFVNRYGWSFTPIYLTPGTAAAGALEMLTAGLLLLLLFYTVESLRREPATGASAVVYTTPVRTASLLLGKALANAAVVGVVLLAAGIAAAGVMRNQGGVVEMELAPFVLVWGLLLLPTLVLWASFLLAVYALSRSRYGTYAAGFAALGVTLWAAASGHLNWVGNWMLLGAVRWSDMGLFPLDGRALLLNRLLALGLAALLGFLAVRLFTRQDRDPLHPRLGRRPGLRRRTVRLAAGLAVVPLALAFALQVEVNRGFEGGAVRKLREDYWRENHATWMAGAPLPYVTHVDLDVDLEPARRGFRISGFYDLRNEQAEEIPWFPVTAGPWQGLAWTLDGRPVVPEDRHGLHLFRLPRPLPPGGTLRLGFRYRGTLLPGISRKGGELPLGEFILPAGGIVTGRNPGFVPVVGYDPAIGVAEEPERQYQPRLYPPGWHHGITEAELDKSAFTQRLRITAPEEYTVTSTGVLAGEEVQGGRRTATWVSDYPVRVFNIAFGRWAERRGQGTAVYFHPEHTYNVDSLLEALDGARRHYAEWFHPFPWRELRLNEFPDLARYARGNATNIFFSEGVGFLTRPTPDVDLAFVIAAHEAAHSWWGHIVQDGEGPGGIVMSEGTAHFATLLLLEEMRGPRQRIHFAAQAEVAYGEFRQPSDEKPLAETFLHRPGDTTVVYDKGAWVFWMLMHQMGREPFLEGVREYFRIYHDNPDHPVVQDFVAVMRRHAPDPTAFDAFVRQWFFEVVTPEYQLGEPVKERRGAAWEVTVAVKNAGTGRMPVEIAATRGPRWGEGREQSPDYRDARVTLVLGPGEEKLARIRTPFEPDRVVVDPDARVMQLERQAAAKRL